LSFKYFINRLKLFNRKLLYKLNELLFVVPDFLIYIFLPQKLTERQVIVFAGTYMHARIGRLAKWVQRKSNYEIHLICGRTGFLDKLSNDNFQEIHLFRNKWHLKQILKKYDSNSIILHAFGPPHLCASEVMKSKLRFKKVFDYQDLMITNFGFNPPFAYMRKELEQEEVVLKNAEMIVNHSLELQVAKRNYNQITAKKLFFPNFTDNDFFVRKTRTTNNELNLVYAGSVYSKFRNSDYFGGSQLHWLIDKLNDQGIHFHIYPAPTNVSSNLADYAEMDKELEYFHLHAPLKQEDLSKALCQYDFGVLPFFDRLTKVLPQKRRYSTTLKLLNYAEAGIPVLLSEDLFFQHYLGNKVGVAIKTSWDEFGDLKSKIEHLDRQKIQSKLYQNREDYSLSNRIDLLLEAYQNL